MPLDVACRVWDVFLRDGEEFLFRTALGKNLQLIVTLKGVKVEFPTTCVPCLKWNTRACEIKGGPPFISRAERSTRHIT